MICIKVNSNFSVVSEKAETTLRDFGRTGNDQEA